jgi:hypothetical protein
VSNPDRSHTSVHRDLRNAEQRGAEHGLALAISFLEARGNPEIAAELIAAIDQTEQGKDPK